MRRDTAVLSLLFAASGVLHFVKPEPFESIVPRGLPARRELVLVSGAAELACAAGMVVPRTRPLAGRLSAALLVAVFPANVQMAVDVNRSRRAPLWFKIGTIARLPLQWPLVRIAQKTAQRTARDA